MYASELYTTKLISREYAWVFINRGVIFCKYKLFNGKRREEILKCQEQFP